MHFEMRLALHEARAFTVTELGDELFDFRNVALLRVVRLDLHLVLRPPGFHVRVVVAAGPKINRCKKMFTRKKSSVRQVTNRGGGSQKGCVVLSKSRGGGRFLDVGGFQLTVDRQSSAPFCTGCFLLVLPVETRCFSLFQTCSSATSCTSRRGERCGCRPSS